jgi:hypothetical protein
MKNRRKSTKKKDKPIKHDFTDKELMPHGHLAHSKKKQDGFKKPKARETREERLRRELDAEENERTKLKTIMIGICTFLESKYMETIHKISLERDPNLYYDIALDLLEFLYHFPFEGSRFHEYPKEFLKFLK